MVKGVEKKQLSIGTEVSMTSPAGHSALYNLPLVFITPFGRCGNLYLLSLLDSHEQILLFPFSFYRYWNVIFAEQAVDPNSMFSCWKNFFQNSDMFSENPDALYKADYPKIFDFTENQVEKFYSQFRSLLFDRGISRKNVFFSIWEAYLEVKETDLSKIKVIVSHDHLPFSLGKMVSDFSKSRFLFLIRDVRAAIAGSLKNNKNFFGDVPDQSFNLTFEMWWEGVEFLGKHSELMGEGLKVIRNEDLNNNVEAEMRKIAAWLGIEFSQSLKESTYKGKPWYVKTSYSLDKAIPVNGEYVAPDQKDFHSETNQNIRWDKELSLGQLAMIESFYRDLMVKYSYPCKTPKSFFWNFYGLITFLLPRKDQIVRWRNTYPKLREFNDVGRGLKNLHLKRIWEILPAFLKMTSYVFFAIGLRFRIYFLPGDRSCNRR